MSLHLSTETGRNWEGLSRGTLLCSGRAGAPAPARPYGRSATERETEPPLVVYMHQFLSRPVIRCNSQYNFYVYVFIVLSNLCIRKSDFLYHIYPFSTNWNTSFGGFVCLSAPDGKCAQTSSCIHVQADIHQQWFDLLFWLIFYFHCFSIILTMLDSVTMFYAV